MNPEIRNGIELIVLGIAIPSIILAIFLPGADSYTDQGGLAALIPFFVFAPAGLVAVALGIYKLYKSLIKK